jgi:hypothetical protein
MRKSRHARSVFVSAAVFAVVCAAGAEELTVRQQLVKARQEWLASGRGQVQPKLEQSPQFGTDSESVVDVQAYAFQPGISNDQLLDDGNGYRYFGAPTADPYTAAPVQLPTGVVIDAIALSYCGSGNFGDLVLGLYDNQIGGNPNIQIATLVSGPIEGGGCTQVSVGTVDYLYSLAEGHPLYFVIFWASNPLDGSVRFNSAEVLYHRVVSPAPAMASFNDVPTSHPFFQYIEALHSSLITGGCGGGDYCPNAPVTRGQMAVFLAKALGLHWPY